MVNTERFFTEKIVLTSFLKEPVMKMNRSENPFVLRAIENYGFDSSGVIVKQRMLVINESKFKAQKDKTV